MAKSDAFVVEPVDVTVLERAYVRKALSLLEASLKRSVSKEFPGSEILRLREDEVRLVSTLISKF